ncbi:MAG TPA: acyl-CoA reductase, partial [Flavobacterium sp.]|nr:acyl-CoA reductase [Flavobacterium sp.]
MDLETKKNVFVTLGRFLNQFAENNSNKDLSVPHTELFFEKFEQLIQLSQSHNGWYTPDQVYFSIQSWAKA